MRKLMAGQRVGTPLVVLLLAVAVLTSALGIGVAAAFGISAHHTRLTLLDLKRTIYTRCLQRQTYDRANHDSVAADADLYQQLLDLAKQAPRETDPLRAALARQEQQVIRVAQQRKAAAARAGVIGSCQTYR